MLVFVPVFKGSGFLVSSDAAWSADAAARW